MTVGPSISKAARSCSVFVAITEGGPSPPPVVPFTPQLLVAAQPISSDGGKVITCPPDVELLDEELLEDELLEELLLEDELLEDELLEVELLEVELSSAPVEPPQAPKFKSVKRLKKVSRFRFVKRLFMGIAFIVFLVAGKSY